MYGQGSIQPLEPKSRYKCRKWRLFVHVAGKRRSKTIEGTYRAAQSALAAFKQEVESEYSNGETLASYALSWLGYREALGELAPGTLANNRREIAALARCELSTLPLVDVTPRECRELLLWIKQHPRKPGLESLSNTTMNKLYITLAAIMAQAVDDGLIAESPMRKIPPPKPDTQEKSALLPEQLMHLVGELSTLPLDGRVMAVYVIALLGLRRGEACALSAGSVHGACLTVDKAVKERDGTIGVPKSPASVRTLPIPAPLSPVLQDWWTVREARGWSGAPLCCNTRGGLLRPQLLQRWWTGDAKHSGIRDKLSCGDITLHQLRHSNLSMMARAMSPYDLQRYAGWSSIEPAKVYIHENADNILRAQEAVFGRTARELHETKQATDLQADDLRKFWSGGQDLNLRPDS